METSANTENVEERLLTPGMVGYKVGKRTRWVYDRIRNGEIEAINIGTEDRPAYRISNTALEKYLEWKKV